jgi:putative transposase
VQRGNRRQAIFSDDKDRSVYVQLLRDKTCAARMKIWAYTLMPNHVHIICVPIGAGDLGDVFRAVHGNYSQYFNVRHRLVGHLFQARYYSAPLADDYLYNAVRYVERNPVRAGLVERAEEFEWSSAAAHCGHRRDSLLAADLPVLHNVDVWSEWLRPPDGADVEFLRQRTLSGRPVGSMEFVARLEQQLGKPLLPRARGPRKGG